MSLPCTSVMAEVWVFVQEHWIGVGRLLHKFNSLHRSCSASEMSPLCFFVDLRSRTAESQRQSTDEFPDFNPWLQNLLELLSASTYTWCLGPTVSFCLDLNSPGKVSCSALLHLFPSIFSRGWQPEKHWRCRAPVWWGGKPIISPEATGRRSNLFGVPAWSRWR